MTDCLSLRERYFVPGMDQVNDPAWLAHLQACPECRLAQQGIASVDRGLCECARRSVPVPPFEAIAGAVAGAARAQRRRRVVRRSVPFLYTALGTAALAASVLAVLWVGRAHRLAPKLLSPGQEIQATAEAKSAVLANGVKIRLDTGTLKLAAAGADTQSLLLSSGRVLFDVPKLPAGNTLSVRTPDAEVRVHGTRFQVLRTTQETQVHVTEGTVEVRPEGIGRPAQTLRAGESATIPSVEVYRENLRRLTLAALDHGEFGAAEKQIGQLLGDKADGVQQAEAQALLAWSLLARGKRSDAIARYRQALVLLPDGAQPLWAENACAELALLLQRDNPKESEAVWAECLRRFPHGVHAALARSRLHSR